MFTAVAALGVAAIAAHPAGLAGVALFYGASRLVLVVADARLQERIDGPARATVTSVAGVGAELATVALFGVWALGGLALVVALLALGAAAAGGLHRRSADAPAVRGSGPW